DALDDPAHLAEGRCVERRRSRNRGCRVVFHGRRSAPLLVPRAIITHTHDGAKERWHPVFVKAPKTSEIPATIHLNAYSELPGEASCQELRKNLARREEVRPIARRRQPRQNLLARPRPGASAVARELRLGRTEQSEAERLEIGLPTVTQ